MQELIEWLETKEKLNREMISEPIVGSGGQRLSADWRSICLIIKNIIT